MRRNGYLLVMALLVVLAFGVHFGDAAWKAARWKYHDGDLSGTDCVQSAVDNLDTRLDVRETTLSSPYLAVTTHTTLAFTNGVAYVDASGAAVNATLPDASTKLGGILKVVLTVAGNNGNVITDGTDLFVGGDGGASDDKAVLDAIGDNITLQATAADVWTVLDQNSVSSFTTQ